MSSHQKSLGAAWERFLKNPTVENGAAYQRAKREAASFRRDQTPIISGEEIPPMSDNNQALSLAEAIDILAKRRSERQAASEPVPTTPTDNQLLTRFIELAAQCWCDPRTATKVMDTELATVFAEKLQREVMGARTPAASDVVQAVTEYLSLHLKPGAVMSIADCVLELARTGLLAQSKAAVQLHGLRPHPETKRIWELLDFLLALGADEELSKDQGNKALGFTDLVRSFVTAKPKAPAAPEGFRFSRGQRVRKLKGYKFEGRVVGSFEYFDNPYVMVNVQHDDGWVMHFRENDLELITEPEQQGQG